MALSRLHYSMYICTQDWLKWNAENSGLCELQGNNWTTKVSIYFHQHVTIVVAGNLYSSDRCKFGLLAWREWIYTVVKKWSQVCLPSRLKIISCSNTDFNRKLEWFSKRKMCKRLVLRIRMVQIIDWKYCQRQLINCTCNVEMFGLENGKATRVIPSYLPLQCPNNYSNIL